MHPIKRSIKSKDELLKFVLVLILLYTSLVDFLSLFIFNVFISNFGLKGVRMDLDLRCHLLHLFDLRLRFYFDKKH